MLGAHSSYPPPPGPALFSPAQLQCPSRAPGCSGSRDPCAVGDKCEMCNTCTAWGYMMHGPVCCFIQDWYPSSKPIPLPCVPLRHAGNSSNLPQAHGFLCKMLMQESPHTYIPPPDRVQESPVHPPPSRPPHPPVCPPNHQGHRCVLLSLIPMSPLGNPSLIPHTKSTCVSAEAPAPSLRASEPCPGHPSQGRDRPGSCARWRS